MHTLRSTIRKKYNTSHDILAKTTLSWRANYKEGYNRWQTSLIYLIVPVVIFILLQQYHAAVEASEEKVVAIQRVNTESIILSGHNAAVSSVAFSPDGTKVVSGSSDGNLILWDVKTEEILKNP